MPAQLLLVNPSRPPKKRGRPLPAPIVIEGSASRKKKAKSKTTKAKRNPMARKRRTRTASGRFAKKSTARKTKRRARRNPARKIRSLAAPTARARPPSDTQYGPVRFDQESAETRKSYTKTGRLRRKPGPKNGSKRRARRAAAKKTTGKRRSRRAAAPRTTTRRRRRRVGSKARARRSWNKGLSHQVKLAVRKINGQLRKTGKGKRGKRTRRSGTRAVLRARKAALQVQRRYLSPRGGLSGEAKRMARAHGLMRVNPSLKSIGSDLLTMLPSLGAFGGAAIATTFIGKKIADQLAGITSLSTSSFVTTGQHKVAVSAGLSIGAYAAARMIAPLNKYASAILLGGFAVTLVQLLNAKLRVADTDTLGAKIGIPALGDYVGMNGFVNVGGRQLAVNGVGEYVGMSGFVNSNGRQIAVNGMGEYVGMGDIFSRGTLGDAAGADQLPSGRSDDWGTQGEQHITDFLDEDMDGALSGSIFD